MCSRAALSYENITAAEEEEEDEDEELIVEGRLEKRGWGPTPSTLDQRKAVEAPTPYRCTLLAAG
jgi:hypothetical protein